MGLSWFRPRGRMSSKGVCEGTVLSCTRSACSRGYKRGERGREAPKSLLEEGLSVANSDVGARSECVCSESCVPREPTDLFKGCPPPPFIDTRRDGYMHRGSRRSSFLPELWGYNNRVLWEVHCGVWRRVWRSSWPSSLTSRRSRRRTANSSKRRGRHCRMFSPPDVAFRGPCGSRSCVHQRWRGTRRSRTLLNKVPMRALRRSEGCAEVPDPSRGEVQDSGCVC